MSKTIKLLILYFLSIATPPVNGQPGDRLIQYSNSLYRQLGQIKNQEEKAVGLLDLSFFWSDHNVTKALHYISEAKNLLGTKIQTDYYGGLIAFYTASVYFDKDPDKAKDLYMEAERLLQKVDRAQELKAVRYRARIWGSYGALLQREDKANEYVDILLDKVIPLAEQTKDVTLLGINYQNVAMNLMNLQEYAKAAQYYRKALSLLREQANASEERLTLYVNAARNALYAKEYHQSKMMLDTASVIANLIPNSIYVPMYHTVAGSYHAAVKNFEKAHEHLSEGLITAKILKNDELISTLLYDQFKVYQQNKQHVKAKGKLLEVLPYVEKTSSLANKQMVYYHLATTTVSLNQYQEAVKWYEAYKVVTDSLFTNKNRAQILELERKYQTTEKEKELLKIKSQHQEQSLALQKNRSIAIIFASLCTLLFVLGFTWYRTQKSKKRLLEQKELLLQEELKNHRQKSTIHQYNAMLQGEEKERSRLARDLHDGLGGMLASVKMKLSAVTDNMGLQRVDAVAIGDLQSIISQLDQSVNELRRVSHNLMPDSLLYRGLEDAIRDLCKSMTQSCMSIDFQSFRLRGDYSHLFLMSVYRIVQELLTNALKHSEADQVWVQCSEENDILHLSVEDNGKGFKQSTENVNNIGMGLSNIRNRIALLNGHFEIDTYPGKGSSFHVQIPMYEQQNVPNS
ncbi:Signal transduction histidine kinase [Pedobacter antarcticus]|uniref:Oxygen sensor histidine kinase NreB n=1 Tax=Pedobacter antarcticus TaxID=34086 RepID=A0A1I2A1C6_9SPHI|nr:ATP-binding protein [Pedobacter antarcticus]SFE37689.1 Signal transduction histidine kinase [Pedobacter antarcticus]